jgi:hypothetical protein
MRTYKSKGGIKNKTKKNICSPVSKLHKITPSSCMTPESIIELKKIYNSENPDKQIQTNNVPKIIKQLRERYSCNADQCWLNQIKNRKLREAIQKKIFIPEKPKEWKKNSNEWLSNFDILNVLKQYEEAYPFFRFIGPSPIDFNKKKLYGECVWEELCKFSLANQIKKGKTKIGIIFNTDPHDKPGKHWISLFINIKKKRIFFFDSTGDKMPKQINDFIEDVKKQGLLLKPKINLVSDSNEGIEHQYGNTECGVYSLYFIVHMLEDKTTEHYLKTHILKDEYINKFRHIYFNESL